MCKKCKTHVANKAKICKHCGADVSKAKVIGNTKTNIVNKSVAFGKGKHAIEVKISNITGEKVKNEPKVVNKKEVLAVEVTEKTKVAEKKGNIISEQESISINKKDQLLNSLSKSWEKVKNEITKLELKNHLFKIKSVSGKIVRNIFYAIDKALDYVSIFLSNVIIYIYLVLKKLFYYLSIILLRFVKLLFFVLNEILFNIYLFVCKLFYVIKRLSKSFVKRVKFFVMNRREKRATKKLEKAVLAATIYEIQEESVNNYEIVDTQITKSKKKHSVFKPVFISLFIISLLLISGYFGLDVYRELKSSDTDNVVITSEKATNDKIFGMGQYIDYNGVDYRVNRVEVSMGNAYKSPKSGNQFLIVYLTIRNNTDSKIPYSYENWTMSNSKGDEKKRIFTSINAETALYSGELVIGGIKNGSIVYEQPIKDKKLRMNFYDLKQDKDGNSVIDTKKKIFSVSIKVPETKTNKTVSNKNDVKVLKTTDTIKN